MTLDWYHTGSNAVCSGSYINGVGALTPDEYLVSPKIIPGTSSKFSFWAAAVDATFAADHFGVSVSTKSSNKPGDFAMLQEWTMTPSRSFTGGRQGAPKHLGSWKKYTVDLSSYAGVPIYVAIRHFNCYNQYVLVVDNIELTNSKTVGINEIATNEESNVWFDLNGHRLQEKPTKAGVYILRQADGHIQGKSSKRVVIK